MQEFHSFLCVIIAMAKALFGQLVIGPPGSGKTTYCDSMSKLLTEIGRKVAIINIGEFILLYFPLF